MPRPRLMSHRHRRCRKPSPKPPGPFWLSTADCGSRGASLRSTAESRDNVSVRGRWCYLYRAVDRNGKSVHSLLREDRTIDSAWAFFRRAVAGSGWPQKINLDGKRLFKQPVGPSGNCAVIRVDCRWRDRENRCRDWRRHYRTEFKRPHVHTGIGADTAWLSICVASRCPTADWIHG
jgi:hypothetical protein